MTILFDLDGTLIDSTEAILESFHRSYTLLGGRVPPEEAIKALIGHPLDGMYRELGVEEENIDRYVAAYKEHYRKISREKTVLLPQAREAIAFAATFAKLGVVTTKTGRYSRILLEHFGVMDAFEVLVGREDVTHPKPHPEPVDRAVALMRAQKERCWLIGDTRLDAGSAAAAGIGCVGVLSGYDNREQLETFTPFIEANAFDAVGFLAEQGRNATF